MSRYVLLPAFPLDARMWQPVAGILRDAGHDVLTPDIGGLGTSQVPGFIPSVDVMADQVAAALDDAGWVSANIVGISMGGYVALAMLRLFPARVAGLGLVSTRASMDSPAKRAERLRQSDAMNSQKLAVLARALSVSLTTANIEQPTLAEQVRAWIQQQSPVAVSWCLRAMATRPDSLGTLRTAGGRHVAIVCGDADVITTHDDARQMHAACLDAGAKPLLQVLPAVGHLSALASPAAVAAALGHLAMD